MTAESSPGRDRADKLLAQMEDRYFGLLEAAPDAMVVVDQHGTIVLLNLRAEHQFGYSRDELLGQPVTAIIPEGFAERLIADSLRSAAEALSQQIGTGIELSGRSRDGTDFPIEIMLSPLETAEGLLVTVAIRDISARRASEKKIIYLNRIYATLSGINTLIVRVHTCDALFREACRLAVTTGEFSMAWIGLMDPGGMKLDLVASAGMSPDMPSSQGTCLLHDGTSSCGPLVLAAVSRAKAAWCNAPQPDNTHLFGIDYPLADVNSMVVLPLIMAEKVVGVFALYVRQSDFFDDVELGLLAELAGDIAYAMANISKQDQLSYLAYYDNLTGLANYKLFLERVAAHLHGARREGHQVALYLIDLEGFKNINDSLGQTAGDSLLKQVADWLAGQVGDVNLLARIGADRFAVVQPNVKSDADVVRLVKKSMAALMEHEFHLNETMLTVAAKVGIALFPDDAPSADELFKRSEAALKLAKQEGDRFLFYTRKMTDMVASRLTLENQLRRALSMKQFVLHYQPIINLGSGDISGAEALIRWNHPEAGMVPPAEFIPILEETGMIHDVGRWVMAQAIQDYLGWSAVAAAEMRISVNVSQLQLQNPRFVDEMKELLAADPDAAAGLELEITEGLMMVDVDRSIACLSAIRESGVRIAMDDFGTGYSSLSHLTRLPLDTLKIDRTFVRNMTISQEGHVLVHAIISLAHLLKMNVVAEGVETQEQCDDLKLLNCNEVQGFLFSKPMAAEQFETLLVTARKVREARESS